MERRTRLGNAAQSRRLHVSQIARCRQGRPERDKGARLDAGAALDDQAAGARSWRQIAGRIQAGDLRQGSEAVREVWFSSMISSAAPLPKGRRASSRLITALITLTGKVFGV